MNARSAICVVVDGLRASALGAYGNTIYPTPTFDRLAATSTVFERIISREPSLESFYDELWLGDVSTLPALEFGGDFLRFLRQKGVETTVYTDDATVAARSNEGGACQVVLIEGSSEEPAESIDETDMARLLLNAAEFVSAWDQTREARPEDWHMLWVHCKGLNANWDAPLELRAALLEDEEIQPYSGVTVPVGLAPDDDPDLLLAYRMAYAAQVAVLDQSIASLLAAAESLKTAGPTLFSVVSPRGIALGEHESDASAVHNECLHVPCITGVCNAQHPGQRVAGLQTRSVVTRGIRDWFVSPSQEPQSDPTGVQSSISSISGSWYAVRTEEWTIIDSEQSDSARKSKVRLFASPDDRWEFNNVAERCPEVVTELRRFASTSTHSERDSS